MLEILLTVAATLQTLAVGYCLLLLVRTRTAANAWRFLLGGLLSMLVWRLVILLGFTPPAFFNPAIAIWGSSCMVVAMYLFRREVSAREHAEAERDALLTRERAARSEAEQANRLKDDFLATLSHELRSPLAAILGWLSLARVKHHDTAELTRAFDTIERNARAQVRLVEDLLDATRMQAGTLQLDLTLVSLETPVAAALESIRPIAQAKGIDVQLEVAGAAPHVRGDPIRVQQIASNLLMNAVKFTPSGGHVRVRVGSSEGWAELVVTDDGQGIDAAFLPQLFRRFSQADSTVARRHGGLGLGLSIVDNLVRLHGGTVTAVSDGPSKGATFTVRLPLAAEQRVAERRRGTSPPSAGLAGLRVLIVDDENDVRSAVAGILEQHGAAVSTLESGATIEDALVAFRPDLLVVDIGMPGEDGYALMRRVRRLPETAGGRVPAVSLTAHARREDRTRAIASGFQEHLAKPIDVDVLLSTLYEVAQRSANRNPTRNVQ